MKIVKLETICLSRMHEPQRQWVTAKYRTVKADCVVVRIHGEDGKKGIGEASAYGGPVQISEWVEWLARTLVGRDIEDLSATPHPNGRNRAHDAAVAGIDCALWDLRGKLADKRVCEIVRARDAAGSLDASGAHGTAAGAARDSARARPDRVRVYASGGCRYDWRTGSDALLEEAREYIDSGFSAMKFRLGTDWRWDGVTVDRFLGLVRELAAEVGGRMELMLDGNGRLTEEEAVPIALELERLGFAWFEEPYPGGEIEAYARLARLVDMPISGGESLTTLEQFRPYLEAGAYDIVQQDAGLCGISESIRIAEMAEGYGVDVCPHSWHNGLMAMANAHVVAALARPRVLEVCMHQGPLQWGILQEPPTITEGHLVFPDEPGLGVELAEDAEEQFPFIEGHYAITVERR